MDDVTIEALKTLVKTARECASESNKKKRKSYDEAWDQAVLYRDIVQIEDFISNYERVQA